MTKVELIAKVAEKTNSTKKEAELAVSAVIEAITETLAEGEKVSITGFGTFEVKDRKEREGHNPKTNEKIIIPASKSAAFKAGKALKEAVSK